jgi:hypothetical protein
MLHQVRAITLPLAPCIWIGVGWGGARGSDEGEETGDGSGEARWVEMSRRD